MVKDNKQRVADEAYFNLYDKDIDIEAFRRYERDMELDFDNNTAVGKMNTVAIRIILAFILLLFFIAVYGYLSGPTG